MIHEVPRELYQCVIKCSCSMGYTVCIIVAIVKFDTARDLWIGNAGYLVMHVQYQVMHVEPVSI